MPMPRKNAGTVSHKEASLILIINVLNNIEGHITRENFNAAMNDLGFSQFNVRKAGFESIMENFETNKGRALTKAINLLEARGFDIDAIKELDFGLFPAPADSEGDDEEEETPKKGKKSAPAKKEEKPAKKSKKVVTEDEDDEEEDDEEEEEKPAPKKGKKGKK